MYHSTYQAQGPRPFTSQARVQDWPSPSGHYQQSGAYSRPRHPPTPPEEMSDLASYRRQMPGMRREHGMQYKAQEAVVTNYAPYNTTLYDRDVMSRSARPSMSHQASPTTSLRSQASQTSHRRVNSQSHIAPSLQIPKGINSSQGSLAELAASITCLFWFENSGVLNIAKDGADKPLSQPLQPETTPTTGFRKWVTTMLSTTQVAQNVILLGLLFIYRLKRQNPDVRGKLGSEYRLLTVALMLGNKFLDDNTYTNKTWADVSGISVGEVHIMEVEFLSNMKYNLFTSAEQWADWQVQLGRFARFLDRATNTHTLSNSLAVPATVSPIALPSPPSSFQNSPPRTATPVALAGSAPSSAGPFAAKARPSLPTHASVAGTTRKRSLEDEDHSHTNKRVASASSFVNSRPSSGAAMARPAGMVSHPIGGPTLPQNHPQQLPPLSQQFRMTPLAPSGTSQIAPFPAPASQSAMAAALQTAGRSSRHPSPHSSSTNVSPTSMSALPMTSGSTYGQSPSVYLARRDSPYKPVRSVHTLLVPPPSRTVHQPELVGKHQMHYQPLGRPLNEIQQGRLPYISQNLWYDPTYHKMAPIPQWMNHIPVVRQ